MRAVERASSRVTQSPSIRGTETRDGHCDHLSFIELHNLFVEFVISIVMYESLALRTTVSYHQYNLGIIQFTLVATDSRYRAWVRMTDHGHLGLAILRTRVQYTADIHVHLHALCIPMYIHTFLWVIVYLINVFGKICGSMIQFNLIITIGVRLVFSTVRAAVYV